MVPFGPDQFRQKSRKAFEARELLAHPAALAGEVDLLTLLGEKAIFTLDEAREALPSIPSTQIPQFVHRLQKKGWIARIRAGKYAIIPLSSGTTRTPQLHEFLVGMELVKPAAIAYFSALNHHGYTDHLPRTVYIATDHRVSPGQRTSLGFSFKIVSQRRSKFFGLQKAWIDERPFAITDPEKTIIDGLDLPANVGGISIIVDSLEDHWSQLSEDRLFDSANRIGNSTVAKRLGFLMEALGKGHVEALRGSITLRSGFPRLDPTLPATGRLNRRWGLLVNMKVGH